MADNDLALGTGNGIGLTLLGEFRPSFNGIESTHVAYYFFVFLNIPIIPLGCYRVSEVSSTWKNHKRNVTRYNIYGKEKWKIHEVLLLYFQAIAGIALFVGVICLLEWIFS